MATFDTRPFQLTWPDDASRVIRGRVTLPSGHSSGALPWVLVLHGFKGFMDWGFFPELSRRIARGGMAAVAFNTSGSGIGEDLMSFTEEDAFAKATITRQLEDVERVRRCASSGELASLDPSRAGLFGHSRGGGVAYLHAAETGAYRALATWAAVADMDRFDGATKDTVTAFMRKVPCRLLATATAAPNDYIELGTSSEALGALGHMDMLNRFFRNDRDNSSTGRAWAMQGGSQPKWRFKGHAEQAFWRWVCSWARAVRSVSA